MKRLLSFILVFIILAGDVGATSYTNPGGSGDRRASITITTSGLTFSSGTIPQLVDGDISSSDLYISSGTGDVTGDWLMFDLSVPKVIDEVKFHTGIQDKGTWQFQGSKDNTTWVSIGDPVNLINGTAGIQVITTMSANTTAYRYYRFLGTSGSVPVSSYTREFEFKLNNEQADTGRVVNRVVSRQDRRIVSNNY